MTKLRQNLFSPLLESFPFILLLVLVFTGFNLSFPFYEKIFSFNFVYILIFFWTLRAPEKLGYGVIFLAGLVNDIVQNFPIGISSINFLLLCSIAAYVRARTLLPNLFYDWIIFLIAITIISSIKYSILSLVFEFPVEYGTLMSSLFLTFLIYPIFSKLFNKIYLLSSGKND